MGLGGVTSLAEKALQGELAVAAVTRRRLSPGSR